MQLGFSTFVKNEIHSIQGLLDNVNGRFDYYVVVDTGSTDGTWEFLRRFEAKTDGAVHVYQLNIPFEANTFHFGYVRSVAAHLNKAPWVMMLDADERMDPDDLMRIEAFILQASKLGHQALAFPRYNWEGPPGENEIYRADTYPDLQVRAIANNGWVRWHGPVHEVACAGPKVKPVEWLQTDIHIHHYHWHFRDLKDDKGHSYRVYDELNRANPNWTDE